MDLLLTEADGECRRIDPGDFTAGREALRALRAHGYQPGRGTWFTTSRTIRPDSETWRHPSTNQQPRWSIPPEPQHYLREMARFPRLRSATPAWLRVKYRRARHPGLARASDVTATLFTVAAWAAVALLAMAVAQSLEFPISGEIWAGDSSVQNGNEVPA